MPTAEVCALRGPLSPTCLEILSLHGCKEGDQKPEDAAGKDIDDRVSRSEASQPEEAQTERNLRSSTCTRGWKQPSSARSGWLVTAPSPIVKF
jgi:hypothetical protein